MIVRIKRLTLEGVSREVIFQPGLNIITGPIATGKTTLLRLARALLGGSIKSLPIEAKEAVTAISGELFLKSREYTVFRPTVTTRDAIVEIANENNAFRLPFAQASKAAPLTYLHWVLDKLDLPRLDVPSAPTKPESEPTPVTINDYLLYCVLNQDEIGFSVLGHTDVFKNIKRKYVFEIVYGLYSVETAQIQEELRGIQGRLRELKSHDALFSRFLADTALGNRAEIVRELQQVESDLKELEGMSITIRNSEPNLTATEELRRHALALEEALESLRERINREKEAVENLETLIAQLETYSQKLTRSIVAQRYFSDIDFIICPRCGANVERDRGGDEKCYVCLQHPKLEFSREVLVQEQGRIDSQLEETRQLHASRLERMEGLRKTIPIKEEALDKVRQELDFQTKSYVSAQAEQIASNAARRAELKARVAQLKDYLDVLRKLDQVHKWAAELLEERNRLTEKLASAESEEQIVKKRIDFLTDEFNKILDRFQLPTFGEEPRSSIDRKTYLPVYRGRRFDDLISPGLASLVNIAHALAHQSTSIAFDLSLPNILFIDGLSEHLGEEGLDPERLEAVYRCLIETSSRLGDRLQVIVVDNEIPKYAREFIRLELSEEERLIPVKS